MTAIDVPTGNKPDSVVKRRGGGENMWGVCSIIHILQPTSDPYALSGVHL
jgi:hypothetical protein